eukprot:CAMPEP_0202978228 /NCGR_PEP_ID=MMETSP1396-20130829/84724_1 /ASSEMBLY_ACC=CAM_ASM_000872 /TAXON_ID= /ORGANISM="Pseudokeronopsis sp., Strain Brazil" /LENGTH=83 /DNA_ID=CAMNT_0049717135 /DNA_START=2164 /DNA_END=2415 /DNA_ORIENTATION=-
MEELQGEFAKSETKIKELEEEKSKTAVELEGKSHLVKELDLQLKEAQVDYEKELLKMLCYRKEDILDLLTCLQTMKPTSSEEE